LWAELIVIYVLLLIFMMIGWKRTRRFFLFALLVALFPLLYSLALEAAEVEARRIRNGDTGKEITFVFKPDSTAPVILKSLSEGTSASNPSPPSSPAHTEHSTKLVETAATLGFKQFIQANERPGIEIPEPGSSLPKLYLITETTNSFYVLFQPRSQEVQLQGYVYEVPKASVFLSSIQIQ